MTKRRPITKPEPQLYAFWKYDAFPYVLGGPVVAMDATGRVETSNFGPGYWFHPIKLVPFAHGEKIAEDFEKLATAERVAREQLRTEWLAKLNMLRADLGFESVDKNGR